MSYEQSDTLTGIRDRVHAAELISRGLRIAAVRNILPGVYRCELSRLWREIHPLSSTPSGRLPNGSASVIRTHLHSAIASAMLVEYIRASSEHAGCVDVTALCVAWDTLLGSAEWSEELADFVDINVIWLLARDYHAKLVRLAECPRCRSRRLFCTQWDARSKLMKCPHCALAST